MKKMLLGTTLISTLSLGAINLGSEPTTETNIFQTGQIGKIVVEGAITSKIPAIKYVIYSSVDGSYDVNGDKWVLPDITVAQNETDSILATTPKKVYVKRVNGTNDNVEELVQEKVTFTVNRDPFYTNWNSGSSGTGSNIIAGQKLITQPTALLSKSTLEQIIKEATLPSDYVANSWGDIANGRYAYRCFKVVEFYHLKNGELTLNYQNSADYNSNNMGPTYASKVETAFATKRQISNLTITATIN